MTLQNAQPKNPSTIQENWDAQGRMDVEDGFLDPEVGSAPQVDPTPVDNGQPDPAQPAQPAQDDPNNEPDNQPDNQPVEPDNTPEGFKADPTKFDPRYTDEWNIQQQKNAWKKEHPTEPEKPAQPATPEQPKLLAGKYQNEQDLKNAYIQLGGDPERFKSVESLEEAYMVRQEEFTRSRQQIAQEQQQRQEIADMQAKAKTPEQLASEVLQAIDTSKFAEAKNPGELGQMLVQSLAPALVNALQQAQGQQMTPDQIVEKISPIMQKREAAISELNTLERDVPRLVQQYDDKGNPVSNPFRDAFGVYVAGLKKSGQYANLDAAFKSFIGVNQTAVDEGMKQKTKEAELKQQTAATNAPGGHTQTVKQTSPDDDILGGIVTAHEEHVGKFGHFS